MSIQGTKSTSGHKRHRSGDDFSKMAKRICIKNSDDINIGLKIFKDPKEQIFNIDNPLPEEVTSVARMPSAEHTDESYTAQGNINIDPNKDIVSGIGLYQYEKDTKAYKHFEYIINHYKDDYQDFSFKSERTDTINQIMKDLRGFNFVHKEDANPQKTNYSYRRLDKNNPEDKKIIEKFIKNRLN